MAYKCESSASALLIVASLAGTAVAQDTGTKSPPGSSPPSAARAPAAPQPIKGQVLTQPDNSFLSTELVGATVHAADQQKAGSVTNLIFTQDGKMEAVVVGVGGFLGIGSRDIALKREEVQIRMDAGKPVVSVAAQKADLEAAPPFKSKADVQADRDAAAARKAIPGPGSTTK